MRSVTLAFESIPDKAFIPVVRKRDILRAKILSANEKKNLPKGSADVQVTSPLGHKGLMSRNQVMNKYFYLNGHKVKMSGWKNGREYIIMSNDTTPAAAMMIPVNCAVQLNGEVIKPKANGVGDYLVCLTDQNGDIDRTTASVISRSMFRKMFSILPNEVIDKHKGSGNKLFGKDSRPAPEVTQKVATPTNNKNPRTESAVKQPVRQTVGTGTGKPVVNPVPKVETKQGSGKLVTVGRLLNAENKLIGFVVKDSKGMTKQVSKREMLNLCSQKLVENIVIATKEPDGTQYLRGNGIKIESLAPYYI